MVRHCPAQSDSEASPLPPRRSACPTFDGQSWVDGPVVEARRVAIVSTASLHGRDDRPFTVAATYYCIVPGKTAADLVMSHVSCNVDCTDFQQDINVVFPIDRLRELAAQGSIGSVAGFHFSVMGATTPEHLETAAHEIAGLLKADVVDAVLLVPI
jgi:D-proline reductase (dithiol) PrdB